MTPEDRAVFKWIVSWVQGKLSGDKAPSGAAVPSCPAVPAAQLARAHPEDVDQGQDQAPGTRPAGEDGEACGGSRVFTWRGQGTGSGSGPSGLYTWKEPGPSGRSTGRGSGPSGLYTWRRLDDRRPTPPPSQAQTGHQHQQPYEGQQGQQASQRSQPAVPAWQAVLPLPRLRTQVPDMPPTPSVRAVFRRPLQPGLHRRTRRRYTACVLLQRLQGDRTWPTLQVLPCQASPHLPAVQTPREGSTASARHGQGHPVLTSVIDAVVGTDEITEDMDTTQPASHAHVDTADAAAQRCIPQPERYLQFNPKHAPLTKHAEYLPRYRPCHPRCRLPRHRLQGRAQLLRERAHRSQEDPGAS